MRSKILFRETISKMAEVYEKIGVNVKQVEENEKEIYRLSRMLPEQEGLKLIKLHQSTVNNVCEAFQKVGKD